MFSVREAKLLRKRIESLDPNAPSRGMRAKLSPGRTYQVISEALNLRGEPGGRAVHEVLMAEARSIAGPAVPEKGGIPILFGEVLAGQARRAALEHVMAAWYYLGGRHKLIGQQSAGRLRDADPQLIRVFQRVGQELRDRLRNAPGIEFKALRSEIVSVLKAIEREQEGARE
jgi:hypothetical protein